ncbi:MAG: transposase [Phaeodactylibacter sp.]|nr:transposase [Phaeodactylibacter sp.]
MKKRRRHSAEFKFKVAVEALREHQTLSQLASRYELSPVQISQWKKQLLESGQEVFTRGRKQEQHADQQLIDDLHRKVGELQMRLDWLKKRGLGE